MKTYTFERFGGLLKVEPLSCIENDLLIPDTCVLESVSPFMGYYSEKGGQKPSYLYLMLEGSYTFWDVSPIIEKVKKKADFSFDAVFGEVSFQDHSSCYALRIRDLALYNQIADLQKLFQQEGATFRKKSRKIDSMPGFIRLEKFFYFDPWGEQMFIDKQQKHHGYFVIEHALDWETFRELTHEVKFDTHLLFFDAALAYYQQDGRITHLIRIYKEQLTKQALVDIKQGYLKLIKKYTA